MAASSLAVAYLAKIGNAPGIPDALPLAGHTSRL
jgi:hypothetical protein